MSQTTAAVPRLVSPVPMAPAPAPAPTIDSIYREHGPLIARWAGRLAGPAFDTEDVVQEVFLIAHRLLPTFRGEAKITTWLYSITQNVVRHRRRKERWRRWLGGSATDVAGRLASPRPTPIEEIERRQAAATVYRVLDRMRSPYREVLILFELEELSGAEIADLLDRKIATVWVWLHRARAQFLAGLKRIGAGRQP